MKCFFLEIFKQPAEGENPMISLVTANLKDLQPTTIIAAQYELFRSEGEMLEDNFKKAGGRHKA
jgi:acetyl esterase/lipase